MLETYKSLPGRGKKISSLSMVSFTYFVALALLCATTVSAFPATASLAGLSRDEADAAIASLKPARRQPPPGPLAFSGTKLIYDSKHPYKAPGRGDVRGPCPALNALASHGVRTVFLCAACFNLQFIHHSISITTVLLPLQTLLGR
jgi:hypothetical protein